MCGLDDGSTLVSTDWWCNLGSVLLILSSLCTHGVMYNFVSYGTTCMHVTLDPLAYCSSETSARWAFLHPCNRPFVGIIMCDNVGCCNEIHTLHAWCCNIIIQLATFNNHEMGTSTSIFRRTRSLVNRVLTEKEKNYHDLHCTWIPLLIRLQ